MFKVGQVDAARMRAVGLRAAFRAIGIGENCGGVEAREFNIDRRSIFGAELADDARPPGITKLSGGKER